MGVAVAGLALAISVVVTLGACGGESSASSSDSPPAAAAQELLSRIVLLAGTNPIGRGRKGVPSQILSEPTERLPSSIDRYGIWTSNADPRRLLALISKQAPPGSHRLEAGNAGAHGRQTYWWIDLQVPSGVAYSERLQARIALRPTGAEVVRIDALVTPRPKRAPSGFVPATASRLTIDVVRNKSVLQSVQVTDVMRVRLIVAYVNALAPAQRRPGARVSCPYGSGTTSVTMRFEAGASRTALAELRVEPYECGQPSVWLTVPPRESVGLQGAIALLQHVQSIGRLRLAGLPGG